MTAKLSIKERLAMQKKEQPNGNNDSAPAAQSRSNDSASDGGARKFKFGGKNQSKPVQSESRTASSSGDAAKRVDPAPADNSAKGQVAGGASDGGVSSPSTALARRFAKPNGASAKPAVQSRDTTESAAAGGVSDELALLAESTEGVVSEAPRKSKYADEVDADAPTRDYLPDDLDENSKSFISLLNGIYSILHDGEMMGTVIRSIMLELEENPEYRKLMAPKDIRSMLIGARNAMGMARVKKQEKSSRSRGGSSKSRGSKHLDESLMQDLASAGFNLDDI